MKQTLIKFSLFVCVVALITGCSDIRRKPGRVYMPDMAYSPAVKTYTDHSYLNAEGIQYNARPVDGTFKRTEGGLYYEILKDTTGSYDRETGLKNPLPALDTVQFAEAERQYLINCGICHGAKLDGNGPLYKDGTGPYPAKPANLVGDAKNVALTEGNIFHTINYGKNLMGSYASQLSVKQRWMIVHYIKKKQGGGASSTPAAGAAKDSAATVTAAPAAAK